jgi:hypothetical protein
VVGAVVVSVTIVAGQVIAAVPAVVIGTVVLVTHMSDGIVMPDPGLSDSGSHARRHDGEREQSFETAGLHCFSSVG